MKNYEEIELAALSSALSLRKENKMKCWLTSLDRKVHQRAMNRLVHRFNKALEKDDLWLGRFMVRQDECPQWKRYEDGSGAELWVRLRFIDRATERYYVKWETVNVWRGLRAIARTIWKSVGLKENYMSKMKNYDLAMYESIDAAVHHFIEEGRLHNYGFQVYSKKALNGALAFLCLNDIQHSYTVTSLCADFAKFGVHSVVCLSWEGDEGRENFTFWSTMEADYEYDEL